MEPVESFSGSVRDGHQYRWFQRHDLSDRDRRNRIQLVAEPMRRKVVLRRVLPSRT